MAGKLAPKYLLENESLSVEIVTRTFAVNVVHKATGERWIMSDDVFDEVVIERHGEISKETFGGCRNTIVRELGDRGILFQFKDFRLDLLISIEAESLFFELIPGEEHNRFKIKGVCYPRCFELGQTRDNYLVLTPGRSNGGIIPGDWDKETPPDGSLHGQQLFQYDDFERERVYGELFGIDVNWWSSHRPGYDAAHSNSSSMPWWGAKGDKGSMITVLDEDCWVDTFFTFKHKPGKSTSYRLHWLPSFGRLNFSRRVAIHFLEGGYVDMCKRYRQIAEERGKAVTLREKLEKNPNLDKVMGAPILRFPAFMRHNHQKFYHELVMTFQQAADIVEKFHKITGFKKAQIHCRGWQQNGHDVQYPDIVPPCREAGGEDAFSELARRTQALGYAFGLGGDNFHDVALESPFFDESILQRTVEQGIIKRNMWTSGPTANLCASVVLKFLRRNFEVGRTDYPACRGLLDLADLDVYWIGNYISNHECYSPDHPMTRNGCWDAQREIFEYVNGKNILVFLEQGNDWSFPYTFTVSAHDGNEYGHGLPTPLVGLTYHDCIGIRGGGILHASLNGAPISLGADDIDNPAAIEQARINMLLQESVGYEEMVNHEFLTDDYGTQRTTFSNGVAVTIDRPNQTYKIEGVEGIEETDRQPVKRQR